MPADSEHRAAEPSFMEWIHYVIAVVFVLLGAGCVALVVVQGPGTWILLGLALVIELVDGVYRADGDQQTFPWWVLGVAAVLAVLGEIRDSLGRIEHLIERSLAEDA